jgi:hypothetical protein
VADNRRRVLSHDRGNQRALRHAVDTADDVAHVRAAVGAERVGVALVDVRVADHLAAPPAEQCGRGATMGNTPTKTARLRNRSNQRHMRAVRKAQIEQRSLGWSHGESSPNVTYMASIVGKNDDISAADRLYSLAEPQGGYLTAQQALEAGVARSTLTYHAREGGTLQRAGRAVYRLRRFPGSPNEHVVPVWLGLSRADAVVSHVSALELLDLADVIPDEVHVTMPRSKRGTKIPEGVRAHFTDRPISGRDRRLVLGVPVTGVERTITDVVRGDGWTEQIDLAVRQSLVRGMTTLPRLREQLPKSWQARLRAAAGKASS